MRGIAGRLSASATLPATGTTAAGSGSSFLHRSAGLSCRHKQAWVNREEGTADCGETERSGNGAEFVAVSSAFAVDEEQSVETDRKRARKRVSREFLG